MKVRSHILRPSVARGIAVLCAAVFVATARPAHAGVNVWTSHGPGVLAIAALAIDPNMPSTLYAGTDGGGVFAIEQVPPSCVGDCEGTQTVAINDLITLVNIALGTTQPSACPNGLPVGGNVNVAVIIQGVNNVLNGCGG